MISSNPKYRLKGPAIEKNTILNSSSTNSALGDLEYASGQKTTPKNAAQANTWAIRGGNQKRFIRNLRRTFPFNSG